ncbi:hypothetical protein GN244_ATG08447 [Phytophthora infestans]|uniref:Uncharacterized protein n=1 Tax=Phytophthora infestans TaxID=4787 RepID=A0A833T4I7_PHYIN|nr:hypothetical protein GN244_ATG08447 [Phytophthora infestans]
MRSWLQIAPHEQKQNQEMIDDEPTPIEVDDTEYSHELSSGITTSGNSGTDTETKTTCTTDQHIKRKPTTEKEAIDSFGGYRKLELEAFPTAGLEELSPGTRRELRELDWGDETKVYEVADTTLHQWQAELQAIGSTSTYTESQNSSQVEEGSKWLSQDTIMEDTTEPEQEPPKSQQDAATGRFQQLEQQQGLHMKLIKTEWNQLERQWQGQSPFPRLPTPIATWKRVVHADSIALLNSLQRLQAPGYILAELTDAVLEEWTKTARLTVLLHCLDQIEQDIPDPERRTWIQKWIEALRLQHQTNPDNTNLYPNELWTPLKKNHFEGMELLKLCRANKKEKLVKMVLTAQVYYEGLMIVAGQQWQEPSSILEYVEILLEAMGSSPELEAALEQKETTGYW